MDSLSHQPLARGPVPCGEPVLVELVSQLCVSVDTVGASSGFDPLLFSSVPCSPKSGLLYGLHRPCGKFYYAKPFGVLATPLAIA